MEFNRQDPKAVLDEVTAIDEPVVTVYLPYGVQGKDADARRIDRKNVLQALGQKISNSAHLKDRFQDFPERISEAADKSSAEWITPCTAVYIATAAQTWHCVLPQAITAHFSATRTPAIEPLVYMSWADCRYLVFDLRQDQPKMLQGHSLQLYDREITIPENMARQYGSANEDYDFSRLVEKFDFCIDGESNSNRSSGGIPFGYSDRQMSDEDKRREFWLQTITNLFNHNIDASVEKVFLLGNPKRTQFVADHLKSQPAQVYQLDQPGAQTTSDLAQTILQLIIDEKLALADSEMDQLNNDLEEDLDEVVKALDQYRCREIFLTRDDWFGNPEATREDYELKDHRATLLATARKQEAQVKYVKRDVPNGERLAARTF